MVKLTLTTIITADINVCFDLSRSIDLHKISTKHTNEKAIAGVVKGLINYKEFVTWEAVHFGVKQKLSTKITAFEKPSFFKDEQISGPFSELGHEHHFEQLGDEVKMTDVFRFKAPFGVIGRLAEVIFLKRYMSKLLIKRNEVIKDYAETNKWKEVISEKRYL